jgi:hypothetical protein
MPVQTGLTPQAFWRPMNTLSHPQKSVDNLRDHSPSDYNPPHAKRAAIAVAVAPVLALLAFTLIICDLIGVDLGFALFAACTAWVVLEMHGYQKSIDSYHEEYARSHPFLAEVLGDGMADGDSLHA